jgi:hypothetical protein
MSSAARLSPRDPRRQPGGRLADGRLPLARRGFQVDATSASGGGGTEAGDAPLGAASCEAGEVRCQGAALQRCDPAAEPPWRTIQTCPPVTCDAQAALCHLCSPGEHRCAAGISSPATSAARPSKRTAQCNSSVYCDAVAGRCLACLAGEAHCEGGLAQRLQWNRDGVGRHSVASPPISATRAPSSCRCCAPVSSSARGRPARVRRQLRVAALADCATPELCAATVFSSTPRRARRGGRASAFPRRASRAPTSAPPRTAPAARMPPQPHRLGGVRHLRLGGPLRRGGGRVPGRVQGRGSHPGSYRCEGAELQRCRLDGTRFDGGQDLRGGPTSATRRAGLRRVRARRAPTARLDPAALHRGFDLEGARRMRELGPVPGRGGPLRVAGVCGRDLDCDGTVLRRCVRTATPGRRSTLRHRGAL